MMLRSAAYLGFALASIHAGALAQPAPAATAFDTMKSLVGMWRIADQPDATLRIQFSLTAGGTVLVESWSRKGQPHSLTLYHRDGADLVATHYCPQGNQPRLRLTLRGSDGSIDFTFRDATDLDAGEAYLVALGFRLPNTGTILRRETYRQRGVDTPSELRLVRDR